jgi:hypothetical protein
VVGLLMEVLRLTLVWVAQVAAVMVGLTHRVPLAQQIQVAAVVATGRLVMV